MSQPYLDICTSAQNSNSEALALADSDVSSISVTMPARIQCFMHPSQSTVFGCKAALSSVLICSVDEKTRSGFADMGGIQKLFRGIGAGVGVI